MSEPTPAQARAFLERYKDEPVVPLSVLEQGLGAEDYRVWGILLDECQRRIEGEDSDARRARQSLNAAAFVELSKFIPDKDAALVGRVLEARRRGDRAPILDQVRARAILRRVRLSKRRAYVTALEYDSRGRRRTHLWLLIHGPFPFPLLAWAPMVAASLLVWTTAFSVAITALTPGHNPVLPGAHSWAAWSGLFVGGWIFIVVVYLIRREHEIMGGFDVILKAILLSGIVAFAEMGALRILGWLQGS